MSLQLQYNISNIGGPSAALPCEIFIENELSNLSNQYHPLASDLIDESFSLKDVIYEDEQFNNPAIFENTEFEAYQLQLSSQDNNVSYIVHPILQTQSEVPNIASTLIADSFDPLLLSSFTDFTPQNPLNVNTVPDVTLTQDSFIPFINDLSALPPDVGTIDWDSVLPSSSSNSSSVGSPISFDESSFHDSPSSNQYQGYADFINYDSSSSVTSISSSPLSKKYFTSPDSISSNSEGEPPSKISKLVDPQSVLPRVKRSYRKRSEEERKARKKEQNKTAAIRYREKKKKEMDDYSSEEQILMEKNTELRNQFEEVSRESKYLKKLLRELFVKEGILKSTST